MKRIATTAITIFTSISLTLQASENHKEKQITLSEFKFSHPIVGANPTKNFLSGKVVILEYWGIG